MRKPLDGITLATAETSLALYTATGSIGAAGRLDGSLVGRNRAHNVATTARSLAASFRGNVAKVDELLDSLAAALETGNVAGLNDVITDARAVQVFADGPALVAA